MLEVHQNLHRLADDRVGALALHVDHEADTARVVLGTGVVQALRRRLTERRRNLRRGTVGDVYGIASTRHGRTLIRSGEP